MDAKRIAPFDLTWLNMDRPNNLMVVNGLIWFDSEPDWDAVRDIVQQRLIERYDVLSRRPEDVDGKWLWAQCPKFDLDRQLRRVTLPAPGDRGALEGYVSTRASQPLDRDFPLWEMDFISGYRTSTGEPGAAALARFHHSLADGIRIVQLVLGLCDPTEGATPTVVGRDQSGAINPITMALRTGRKVATDAAAFAGDVARSAAVAVPRVVTSAPGAAHEVFNDGVGLITRPTRLTDAVSGVADETNTAVNTWRSAARLTLWGNSSRVLADRAPSEAKRVVWIEGIELETVKTIGKRHGATVNDVLMGAVALGFTRYLAENGRGDVDEAAFLVPVSLKPVDAELPAELGNHFAMVMFPMPLGRTVIRELLPEVHSRMTRIKNSAEAMMIFGVQRAVAEAPSMISEWLTEFVADKTVGVLTNVPGPRAEITLAGTPVAGILGWVPTAGDQSLGLCIVSYAGRVNIGLSVDAAIMPDPGYLADLIAMAVDEMAADVVEPPDAGSDRE
jgi:diacylglycerol O-acyltransferase / wax synthase